jgi:hypothetical protein
MAKRTKKAEDGNWKCNQQLGIIAFVLSKNTMCATQGPKIEHCRMNYNLILKNECRLKEALI